VSVAYFWTSVAVPSNSIIPLKAEQTLLSADELNTVKDGKPGSIMWLKEIVKSDGEFLNEALEQETSSKRDIYLDTKVQEEFKGHFGHKFAKGESSTAPSTLKAIVAGGKAEVQFGHILRSVMLSSLEKRDCRISCSGIVE
jgi:hypothetical protein